MSAAEDEARSILTARITEGWTYEQIAVWYHIPPFTARNCVAALSIGSIPARHILASELQRQLCVKRGISIHPSLYSP